MLVIAKRSLAVSELDFWNSTRISLLLAFIHCFIFDLTCYYIYSGNNFGFAIKVATICTGIAWPLFYLISWAKKYSAWIYSCIFVVDGLATYFVWTYKLEIRADSLALMYESNLAEASAFIGFPLVSWLIACVSLAFVITYFESRGNFSQKKRYLIFVILLLIGTLCYSGFKYIDYRMPKPLPASVLQESQRYFKEKSRLKKMLAQKVDIGNSLTKKPEDKMIIILVIGESARADHFSLNGYNRKTNPELEKRDVISYKNVISCGNQTRISVPCMLTRNTVENHNNLLNETSLISLFHRAGFSTAWYSSQRVMHENDTITTSIANEAESIYFTKLSYNNARDEHLLPKIKEFVANGSNAKMLIVHTVGSHWSYNHRYDKAHEKFKPVCTSTTQKVCSREKLINSYDNSILYTDWFLASTIDFLKNENAMLIYVSDHGESLGEDGFFSHGQDEFRLEQRSVPLILWASTKYRALYPARYESVKNKSKLPASHDVIFHSTLDCAGIEAKTISKSLSLCADNTANVSMQLSRDNSRDNKRFTNRRYSASKT